MKTAKVLMLGAVLMLSGMLSADDDNSKKGCCGRGCKDGDEGGHRGMMMTKELNLTESQQEQIKGIREANADKMKSAMEAVGEARKAFMEASSGDSVDRSEISGLAQELADAMTEMAVLKSDLHTQMKAVLNDEQKEKLQDMKQKMQQKMKQRMEERRKQLHGNGAGEKGNKEGKGRGEGKGRKCGERDGCGKGK